MILGSEYQGWGMSAGGKLGVGAWAIGVWSLRCERTVECREATSHSSYTHE
jgi:hypothetical protein